VNTNLDAVLLNDNHFTRPTVGSKATLRWLFYEPNFVKLTGYFEQAWAGFLEYMPALVMKSSDAGALCPIGLSPIGHVQEAVRTPLVGLASSLQRKFQQLTPVPLPAGQV